MPINKDAYKRYKIIDACISNKNKPYPSMQDLIEACHSKLDVSPSSFTIQKDIQAMKEDEPHGFGAPIKFSKRNNGYYYSNPDFSIRKIPLTDGDIDALKTAMDLLSNLSGIRVGQNLNHAIEKILTSFQEQFPESNTKRKIIQTDTTSEHKGFEHFELLFKATKDKLPVCFVHYSYSKREFKSVIIHPILLKEFQNNWYIVGYSEHHKELRTFGLDRIYEPLILNKPFKETKQKIQEEYFKYVYGVYPWSNEKRQKIIISVLPLLTNYFQAHPIHESQIVEVHSNGDATITFDLIPSMELINFFLSFSQHLRVIQPDWIQEHIIKQHMIAIDNEKKHRQKISA
jgi:predicted DNA-binding transcriptional regulator YafY